MQSFTPSPKSAVKSSSDESTIFAPYVVGSLTRAYVIYSDAKELPKTERAVGQLPGFCLVGWQINRNVALQDIIQLRPELIIVYSQYLSSLDLALVQTLKEQVPESNLLFISATSSDNLKNLLQTGANGFCSSSANIETLSLALKTVALGGIWIDPASALEIFDTGEHDSELSNQLLSDRERQVLHLIAEGLTNQEIALKLWLSRETIKSHVKKIMRKLAVKDRTQAAVAALRLGLSV